MCKKLLNGRYKRYEIGGAQILESVWDISLSLDMVIVCFIKWLESLKYFYKKQILLDMSGFLINIPFAFGP